MPSAVENGGHWESGAEPLGLIQSFLKSLGVAPQTRLAAHPWANMSPNGSLVWKITPPLWSSWQDRLFLLLLRFGGKESEGNEEPVWMVTSLSLLSEQQSLP